MNPGQIPEDIPEGIPGDTLRMVLEQILWSIAKFIFREKNLDGMPAYSRKESLQEFLEEPIEKL